MLAKLFHISANWHLRVCLKRELEPNVLLFMNSASDWQIKRICCQKPQIRQIIWMSHTIAFQAYSDFYISTVECITTNKYSDSNKDARNTFLKDFSGEERKVWIQNSSSQMTPLQLMYWFGGERGTTLFCLKKVIATSEVLQLLKKYMMLSLAV